jgi:hypothetical protein
MIAFLEKRRAAKQESRKLVSLVHSGLPVGSEDRINARRLTANSTVVVRQLAGVASAFAREQRAGLLWRSYLANRVRWGLKDLGYSDDFVDSITASIVMAMEQTPRD